MQVKGKGGKTDQSSRVNSGRPVKTNYIVCTGESATSLPGWPGGIWTKLHFQLKTFLGEIICKWK